MQRITTTEELTREIKRLEIKQASDRLLLNEQLHLTYESLKPANLIKKTLSDMAKTPELRHGLMNAVVSMAAGYFSKRVVVGTNPGPVKGILGSALQMLVTKFVSDKTKKKADTNAGLHEGEDELHVRPKYGSNNEYSYD